jgi:hypothetical protein
VNLESVLERLLEMLQNNFSLKLVSRTKTGLQETRFLARQNEFVVIPPFSLASTLPLVREVDQR